MAYPCRRHFPPTSEASVSARDPKSSWRMWLALAFSPAVFCRKRGLQPKVRKLRHPPSFKSSRCSCEAHDTWDQRNQVPIAHKRVDMESLNPWITNPLREAGFWYESWWQITRQPHPPTKYQISSKRHHHSCASPIERMRTPSNPPFPSNHQPAP